jgi:aspartate racemase
VTRGPHTIGVLGGMGPEATILLQRRVMQAVHARDDHDHIPLLIDMNPQVPSRIAHLIEGTGEDPGQILGTMARRLQDAGCAALAMRCNTAHNYADAITDAVQIPLLNMIDLAAEHAAQQIGKGGTVGILASPAVRQTRLFERALESYGINVIWPDRDAAMLMAILQIKAGGPVQTARDALNGASSELAAAGALMQFIACSEFSLIADSVADGAHAIDTVDLLAQSIVKFSTAP